MPRFLLIQRVTNTRQESLYTSVCSPCWAWTHIHNPPASASSELRLQACVTMSSSSQEFLDSLLLKEGAQNSS